MDVVTERKKEGQRPLKGTIRRVNKGKKGQYLVNLFTYCSKMKSARLPTRGAAGSGTEVTPNRG